MSIQVIGTDAMAVQLYEAYNGVAPSNPIFNNFVSTITTSGAQAVSIGLANQFATLSDTAFATMILNNVQINSTNVNSASLAALTTGFANYLHSVGVASRGTVVVQLINILVNLESDATFGVAARAFNDATSVGFIYASNPLNVVPASPSDNAILTPHVDVAKAANFVASLTPFFFDGTGPTLNVGDNLTGLNTAVGANNTLLIVDNFGTGVDIMPAGLTLNNIQSVTLNTAGNAGQGFAANGAFDTSPFASVTSTTVTSGGGGNDVVQASNNSSITVTHNAVAGAVGTLGGNNVTVTTKGNGGVTVGAFTAGSSQVLPTGAVTVNANGLGVGAANVSVVGGTSVTVNVSQKTATGNIDIGNDVFNGGVGAATKAFNPTGAISVTSASTVGAGNVDTIFGGTSVTVNVKGDTVVVGDDGTALGGAVGDPSNQPSGAVVVNNQQTTTFDNLTGAGHTTSKNGSIGVFGGTSVTITSNTGGAITVGEGDGTIGAVPTGAVLITSTGADLNGVYGFAGTGAQPFIEVDGGTTVGITAAGSGIEVGDDEGGNQATDNPTGAVTIVETHASAEAIEVNGGNGVTISAQGQTVTVGDVTGTAGAQLVTQASVFTGNAAGSSNGQSSVTVDGGTTVTVNTTGGNVMVGTGTTNLNAKVPSGAVNIVNTFSGAGSANDSIVTVLGGSTVNITETNTTDNTIAVGTAAALDASGTVQGNFSLDPTGNVTIMNAVTNGGTTTYGTGFTTVRMNGGTTASITGGTVLAVVDVNQLIATAGSNAGNPVGTSSLTTVILDGVQSGGLGTIIDSGVFTNLTIADSLKTNAAATQVLAQSGGGFGLANEGAHALNLTLSNDSNAATQVTDNKATTITVGTTGASANNITLIDSSLTGLTFNNGASVTATVGAAAAGKLATVTANGAGALSLGDLSGFTKLTSVNALTAAGGVSVGINSTVTSFQGGSGNDVLTINGASTINGTTFLPNVENGGTGSNTLVANFTGANDVLAAVFQNFQTLQVGKGSMAAAAGQGAFDATGFTALQVGALLGDVTFNNVGGAGVGLSIIAAPGHNTTYNLRPATDTAADTMSLTVGVDGSTKGLIAGTVATPLIETVALNSVGTGSGKNTLTLSDPALKTLTVNGDEAITLTSTDTTALKTVTVNAADAKAVDISAVVHSVTGIAATGGGGVLTAVGTLAGANISQETITLSGGWGVGDTVSATVNGTVYTYTVVASDVGTGLTAAQADANVATGLAGVLSPHVTGGGAVASGGVVTLSSTTPFTGGGVPSITTTDTLTPVTTTAAANGGAAVAQVDTVTLNTTGWDVGDIFTVTINGTLYSHTLVASELQGNKIKDQTQLGNVLTASGATGAAGVAVAATSATTFTITANVAGTGFTSSAGAINNVTGGGTPTETDVTTTANGVAGPSTAQIDTVTLTGGFGVGDVVGETIQGTAITYTVQAPDEGATALATQHNVAVGLAAAINANGTVHTGAHGVTAVANANNTITITANNAGTAGNFTDTALPAITHTAAEVGGVVTVVVPNFTAANDSFTTGAGGGVYTFGVGGAWSVATANGNLPVAGFGAYGTGSETVNLAASTAVTDVLNTPDGSVSTFNGTKGGVTGFQAVGSKTADNLNFTVAKTALANVGTATVVSTLTNAVNMANALDPSGALATALLNLAYTSANGVITFSATGIHTLAEFSDAQLISAAEIIVAASGANKVATFVSHGNTYVVASDPGASLAGAVAQPSTTIDADTVIELLGQATVTGFGPNAAANSIVANVTNLQASARTNTGTATATVYSAAGFSVIDTATSTPLGSASTTINGLAPANQINIDATLGGGNIGPVTVNDAAGSSTILHFGANVSSSTAAPSSITLNGNWQAVVNVDNATGVTLASLNDGGATATMTDLVLTGKGFAGTGTLDIQSVSDSALLTVSAGNLNGNAILGGDNGINQPGSALSQAGLTVNGPGSGSSTGTGTLNVFASGAGDTFNFGTSSSTLFMAYSGGNAIHANGAGDTFNLGTAAAITTYSGVDNVFANGAGDHFTVGNGTAFGTNFNLHASGANDVFTLNGTTFVDGGTTGAVTHGIGANDVFTISTASATTIDASVGILLTGTVTGATSGGAFAFTTITGATGNDALIFGNAANEVGIGQINVASATSLAGALDLAAATAALSQQAGGVSTPAGVIAGHTGVVDWFQFGGNTYVVEAINSGAANATHTALGTGDVVVKLVGLVDLDGGVLFGTGLGAGLTL